RQWQGRDPEGADRQAGRRSARRPDARGPGGRGGELRPQGRARSGRRGEPALGHGLGPGRDDPGLSEVTDPIARLTVLLAKLPGVGEKTAQRLAFHVLKSPPEYAQDLAQALLALRLEIRLCSVCCNLTANDPGAVCRDPQRGGRM